MRLSLPHYHLYTEVREPWRMGIFDDDAATSEGEAPVEAAVAGSCIAGGDRDETDETTSWGACWRFVLETARGERLLEAEDEEPGCDRRRLALWAAVRGLEAVEGPARVTFVTSSPYVAHGMQSGPRRWASLGGSRSVGRLEPRARDADLWLRVRRTFEFHVVDCVCGGESEMRGARELESEGGGDCYEAGLQGDETPVILAFPGGPLSASHRRRTVMRRWGERGHPWRRWGMRMQLWWRRLWPAPLLAAR